MTWNYRIIHHDTDLDPTQHWLGVHEVFYDDGAVTSWTRDAVNFVCDPDEGAEGLIRSLEQALQDVRSQSVLRERQLPQRGTEPE